MNTTQNSTKSKIVKVIGVDLAKDHCDVIGYDENGKICLRLDGCSYAKLREILSNLPQAVVLMEACKGSMFHARSIADLGHEVRLVKGADVKALRNVNHKNDLRDAAYIAKLYFVPGTTYVYIKSQQQQSLQFLQNEYKSLQELRIQAGNQIHAGLEEFGCPVRKSSKFIKTRMVAHLEKHAELIPEDVMASFKRRREIWLNLLQQEEEAKRRLEQVAATDANAKRIMTVPCVGPQTAVGLLVHVGVDFGRFKNSRQFAASLGLVPKQNSTGGNNTLNHITKCGPKRLRSNLVQCAQLVLMYPENRGIYTQSDSPKKSSRNIWSLAVVSVDQRYCATLFLTSTLSTQSNQSSNCLSVIDRIQAVSFSYCFRTVFPSDSSLARRSAS